MVAAAAVVVIVKCEQCFTFNGFLNTFLDKHVFSGQYLLERNLLVCVRNDEYTRLADPNDDADTEQPASRLLQQRMARSSRGAMVMDETSLPKMTVNKVSVAKHSKFVEHCVYHIRHISVVMNPITAVF